MWRMVQVTRSLALVDFSPVPITMAAAQRQPGGTLRGLRTVAFDHFRTNASPARFGAAPEFGHDPSRNPLINNREGVARTGHHSKRIFTDIGKNWNVKIPAKIGELL